MTKPCKHTMYCALCKPHRNALQTVQTLQCNAMKCNAMQSTAVQCTDKTVQTHMHHCARLSTFIYYCCTDFLDCSKAFALLPFHFSLLGAAGIIFPAVLRCCTEYHLHFTFDFCTEYSWPIFGVIVKNISSL